MDLVKAIQALETQVQEKQTKLKSEVKAYHDRIKALEQAAEAEITPLIIAIVELRKQKTVCEKCYGRKEIRYTDAAGSGDWKICPACGGSGEAQ